MHDGNRAIPLCFLFRELTPSGRSDGIEARLSVVLSGVPFAADETSLLEPHTFAPYCDGLRKFTSGMSLHDVQALGLCLSVYRWGVNESGKLETATETCYLEAGDRVDRIESKQGCETR